MDLSLICDTLTIATSNGVGFANFILDRHHQFAANGCFSISSDFTSDNLGILQVTAGMVPVDAVSPPPTKPNSYKTLPRTLLRRKRRTKRKLISGDDSDDGDVHGFFFSSDGSDGYGPFGGGGVGGGGGSSWGGSGWNFGEFGGQNWDESSSSSPWTVNAMDFMYEVICWIALSNCVHFAFKKVVRIVANGIGEAGERGKVPMRLVSVC
ncbi:Ribosomal protein L19e family protein isoform 1 [Hibiscus syriacus]|uniref:Ribosomal protein L19e family protein isoform 1 n=1 Tax=Hibiscus syriacus TaxID=106335 RepID=A0A6A3BL83_HIBSY|nr:uncharacterized protein LOC120189501 [Hibiscus syriacus]XP_039067129.1 uncharacterized protein LOC120213064 [Hibiscus syriacus]KAE8660163.1 Ribosomal protein L19e family protein isoform 1 [Hibiscus syriacus]KAE8717760.1 Ribosomal protein L19e family protein isoform 1 [Hibiscus syriacus]